MAARSGAFPLVLVPGGLNELVLKLNPPPASPAKNASNHRYLWRQLILNDLVTISQ